MNPSITWDSTTKTAIYRFALNGRPLSALDFLALIESQARQYGEDWTYTLEENSATIFVGTECSYIVDLFDEEIVLVSVEAKDLFCWMPFGMRRYLTKLTPTAFISIIPGIIKS